MFRNLFKPKNLWSAAKNGNTKAIGELVAAGHDVNAKKRGLVREGYTPLHIAVLYEQTEAIKELVKLGADGNSKNNEHDTPLWIAVTVLNNPHIIELLLDLGAKIDSRKSDLGMTPLDWAAFDGKLEIVKSLLNRGANPKAGRGTKRSAPIKHCAHNGNVEILKLLLKAGADVNAAGFDDYAIGTAALSGHGEFVKILLAAGADPNMTQDSGTTPLMAAVLGKKISIVKMLVEAGAKLNAVHFSGRVETALDFAEWKSKKETKAIADYLQGVGAKRASELPASETASPPEDQSETFWQLKDDSVLTAQLEPWPPRSGPAKLKVEISTNGHDPNLPFSGTLEYRLVSSEESLEPWLLIKRGLKDEENNVEFSETVSLPKSAVFIQFKVHPKWEKEPSVPAAWKIEVV